MSLIQLYLIHKNFLEKSLDKKLFRKKNFLEKSLDKKLFRKKFRQKKIKPFFFQCQIYII